jgi:acyl dehydratase
VCKFLVLTCLNGRLADADTPDCGTEIRMSTQPFTVATAFNFVGQQTGLSEWLEVTQQRVDAFAEACEDHQWIHTSGPATLAGPFGGPIAHGLLVLSLSMKLAREAGALPSDTYTCIVYGYDKLRFRAPVRSGQRIRCRTTLLNVRELGGRVVLTVRFKVEIENENLPALVADCLLLCLDRPKDYSGPVGRLLADSTANPQ